MVSNISKFQWKKLSLPPSSFFSQQKSDDDMQNEYSMNVESNFGGSNGAPIIKNTTIKPFILVSI